MVIFNFLWLLSLFFLLFYVICCNFVLFINQFLTSEAGEVASIFNELQNILSTQQGEMAVFARELRQVCPLIFTLSCCKFFAPSIPHDCPQLIFDLLKGFATQLNIFSGTVLPLYNTKSGKKWKFDLSMEGYFRKLKNVL